MHLVFVQPLLAVDLTHVAITLVVLFFAVMKQLFDSSSKDANKKREGALAGQQQKLQAGGQQADPLRSQVEEFLRCAGQPPQGGQPSSPPPSRPASEIELMPIDAGSRLPERGRLSEPSRPIETRTAPAPQRPATPEKQRTARCPKRRQSVAEHVAEQVASRSKSIAQMTSQLGQRIVTEDQQFDNKLKAKFDHTLGTLSDSSTSSTNQQAPPAVDSPARTIAVMLANPDGVRQAMIVNEILRRPSDRW